MSTIRELESDTHESVYEITDPVHGLHSIVAIHNTMLGPALGGTRFLDYGSFDEALHDVLLLSRSMTYKAAAADLPLGGGKAVIIGNHTNIKSESLLEAYGRAIEEIGGRYVTAEDVGTSVADMEIVRRSTRHVSGLPLESGGSGDPSPATARGVLAAMKSVAEQLVGTHELRGMRVAIQGVGKVGSALVGLLRAEGCDVVVFDVCSGVAEAVAERYGATIVSNDDILLQPCDILAPCALGGAIGHETVPKLRCRAVVGSANNQLTHDGVADLLEDAGIVYVPDFVANAGGLVNIADELKTGGYSPERANATVLEIGRSVATILRSAAENGVNPLVAARGLAESRLR